MTVCAWAVFAKWGGLLWLVFRMLRQLGLRMLADQVVHDDVKAATENQSINQSINQNARPAMPMAKQT